MPIPWGSVLSFGSSLLGGGGGGGPSPTYIVDPPKADKTPIYIMGAGMVVILIIVFLVVKR